MSCLFDKMYFERGIETGISLYENYRWIPELSIPMACSLKAMYKDKTILDFGCAKGFLVKALKIVGVEAYGYDISDYALGEADKETRPFLSNKLTTLPTVDVAFAKDTLEHISKTDLVGTLQGLRKRCDQAFFIVPFGDNGEYRIKDYHKDLSHQIAEDETWWTKMFKICNFRIDGMAHTCDGFKSNWKHYLKGNGFFFLS